MNPWDLDATGLLVWGMVAHFVCDWPLQNDWMVKHKMLRRQRRQVIDVPVKGAGFSAPGPWWDRHPAAYIHAGIHAVGLVLVFGWPGLIVGFLHLLIDTRVPVTWWAKIVGQTRPMGHRYLTADTVDPNGPYEMNFDAPMVWKTRMDLKDFARQLDEIDNQATFAWGGRGRDALVADAIEQVAREREELEVRLLRQSQPVYDIGMEVATWTDQTFHLVTVVAAAILMSL